MNIRGLVQVMMSANNPYQLDTNTDYDTFGNPITESGGVTNVAGLTIEGKPADAESLKLRLRQEQQPHAKAAHQSLGQLMTTT